MYVVLKVKSIELRNWMKKIWCLDEIFAKITNTYSFFVEN